MKAVVAAFNQEKALVGAFSVITNLQIIFGWNMEQQYPVIGQKYDVIITSSRGPPSLSAVIRAEVNRSVNTLSAAVTPSY